MKAKYFSLIFAVLFLLFSFIGCGLQVPDTTQQINLTGLTNLSVGAQPAEGTFTATGLDNEKVFVDRGKNYGTSPVLPYNWTVSFYNGNQPIKLLEDLSGSSYIVKFYKPGKYIVEVSLRAAFESGTIVNAEVWTGKQIEVNVTQGAGYSAANFTPGIIVSTSTGAAVLLTTNILVVRDWGNTTGYVDTGVSRAGNAILSFDEVKGQKNSQVSVTLSVEGLLDSLSVSGVYFDPALLTFKSVEAISGSGWTINSRGTGIAFSASNSNPQAGKIASFKLLFDTKNVAGTTGVTWSSATISGSYNKNIVVPSTVDGWVKVE